MKKLILRYTLPLLAACSLLVLTGCEANEGVGDNLEDAGESIQDAGEEAGENMEDAADDATE